MKNLSIFVQSASDCLTDYEPHGDGLICHSLLSGLARRNHQIFAYTKHAAISQQDEKLQVKIGGRHRVPFDSLGAYEHSIRADRWLQHLNDKMTIDLVWRMHPYEAGCPIPPQTLGKPLVVGPLFYSWPENEQMRAKPRFGIGIEKFVRPLAIQGWNRTLQAADLIICATHRQAENIQNSYPQAQVLCLPVIVDAPITNACLPKEYTRDTAAFDLVFVANLVPNKNPLILCEAVRILRDRGVNVKATFLGEGLLRSELEAYRATHDLQNNIYLHGKVANHDVFNYLQTAHLLISTSDGEPYGRSIVEAMSVGTPCICHDSGGPAEIIEHKVDGLLVKELTASAFANAIEHVYNNPILIRQLSQNAMNKSKQWMSEVVLNRLEESLLDLV